MKPMPLKFRPLLKEKVWGGERLREIAGRECAAGARIGESWEIVDRGEDQSVVAEGPHAGETLGRLVREHGEALLGKRWHRAFPDRFPLLVKLIHAADTLSVQVHPDDDWTAARGLADLGKTEAWYILDAEPGAVVFKGLRPGLTRDGLRRLIAADHIEDGLLCFPVRRGDLIFLPAGTVHTTGRGVVLLEVQQNSDVTLRLHDWNRRPARPLHVKDALEIIRFGVTAPEKETPRRLPGAPPRERLVACDKFVIDRCRLTRPRRMKTGGAMAVISVIEGAGTAEGGGLALSLKVGDSMIIPACLDSWKLTPQGPVTFLCSTLPRA